MTLSRDQVPLVNDDVERFFANGSATALKMAYDAHGGLVHSFCMSSVGPDRAADVTQETFLAAWRNRERFDPSRGTLAGWLIGIAKNKAIDVHRSAARQRALAERAGAVVDIRFDHEAIDEVADQMAVRAALDELPERARRAVEMSFWSGLTHTEIAEQCDVPLGTVKSDIRRALRRLRRHLEGSALAADMTETSSDD